MTILFIRTFFIYLLVILSLRLMGKRQIGEMQPSELVVAIMISDLACVPMSDLSIPLLYGIVPIFTLVVSEISFSFLSLKSEKIRIILNGRPQILMKDGRPCFKEMKKARVNLDDLLEELRKAGYFSFEDVDTVVLETGGSISVIPSAKADKPTLSDLKITKNQTIIPYVYITDGRVRTRELQRGGRDLKWVERELKKKNIKMTENVFIMLEDSDGNVFVQERKDKK